MQACRFGRRPDCKSRVSPAGRSLDSRSPLRVAGIDGAPRLRRAGLARRLDAQPPLQHHARMRENRIGLLTALNGAGEADDAASTVAGTPGGDATPKKPKEKPEKTPEQQARADEIDMRCLSLCIGMLERVNGVCMPCRSLGLWY